MISKVITRKAGNDNYRGLAKYIADASHAGEKCLMAWAAGCWSGDDYELAIKEIEAVQALNTRTRKAKTYHLMISFRPEDEEKLTSKVLKEIESEFAKALGFQKHQRHCGVHKNTANIHMHVAYNMIHPEKLIRHEPYRDYRKRDIVCRTLEKKYGLAIDNGREQSQKDIVRNNEKAATYEAHSGQQSFNSYVKEKKTFVEQALNCAGDWQEFQEELAVIGLEMRLQGNGCVFKDRHGKHSVKASSLDRKFSKPQLESLLGSFEPGRLAYTVEEKERYNAKPLHRDPERGRLFAEYKTGIKHRKSKCESMAQELSNVRRKWKLKQLKLRADGSLTWKNKRALISLAKAHGLKEEERVKAIHKGQRQALGQEVPYWNWAGFLTMKAEAGNEVALAILRSKNKKATIGRKDMPQNNVFEGMSYRVDKQGNVLYTLASGGMIKDMGKELFFSKHDEVVQEAAEQLAWRKFGRDFVIEGNRVGRKTNILQSQYVKI